MSVTDYEDRVEHALWQSACRACDVYIAAGSTRRDGARLKPEDFYGRELLDIREHVGVVPDGDNEETRAKKLEELQAKQARAEAMRFEALMRRDHPEMVVGEEPSPPE